MIDTEGHVMKSDFIGEVISLIGKNLERIKAPSEGVICISRTCVSVNHGDILAQIAEV